MRLPGQFTNAPGSRRYVKGPHIPEAFRFRAGIPVEQIPVRVDRQVHFILGLQEQFRDVRSPFKALNQHSGCKDAFGRFFIPLPPDFYTLN